MNVAVKIIVISLIIVHVQTFFRTAEPPPIDVKDCYETQMVNDVEIEWKYSIQNEKKYYYSTPLCIDERGRYFLRECLEGMFVNEWKIECHKLQTADLACMDGLELMYGTTGAFCYSKSVDLMEFDEKFECPYKQVDAKDNTKYYFELSELFPVWMPYHRRDLNGGVGYFVPDGFHGTTYEPLIVARNPEELKNNKCLSLNKRKFFGDCTNKRYHACVYRAIHLNFDDELLAVKLEADFCKPEMGSKNFCRISWKINSISCICSAPLAECQTPAVYPTATYGCAIGLSKDVNGVVHWTSTGEIVQNTFWAVDQLEIIQGKYVVASETGWITKDQVACIMCERTRIVAETTVILKYDTEAMLATCWVSNPNRVFNVFDPNNIKESYSIKCFMEATGIVVNIEKVTFPGLWQCEAVDIIYPHKKILSNVVQIDFGKYLIIMQLMAGIHYQNFKESYPPLSILYEESCSYHLIQWMEVSNENETWIEVLYRFDLELSDDEHYRKVYETLSNELSASDWVALKARTYNMQFCSAFTITQREQELHWPEAQVDKESETNCYDKNREPMRIKCVGNFTLGARFTRVPDCYSFVLNITEQLSDLENSDAPPEEILTNLTNILQNNQNFTSEDFNKTANILEKWSMEANVTDLISVISTIMTKNPTTLLDSQREVNVTDRVLYSLDVSIKTTLIDSSQEVIVRDNIECLLIDKASSKYTGAAYLTSGDVLFLENSLSIEEILDLDDLESAVYIKHFSTTGLISITMFKSCALFNENENTSQYDAFQRVFGVLLPENAEDIQIMLVFPRDGITDCAYWLYGQQKYGKWKIDNNMLVADNFTVCIYNHTTHYGQLIMLRSPLDPFSNLLLSTMTAIECGLSTMGLCVILITAAIFPTWRRKKKRLIHYCLVLLVQTVLLFVNTNVTLKSTICILAGALLHFTVLSQFCWMVVIAVHQHRTLIVVYRTKPLFWESRWVMLFTYGLPLVILAIALSMDVNSYKDGGNLGLNICYPSGDVLFYGLIVPTACVAFVNGCLFMWMLIKLTCLTKASSGPATTVVAGVPRTWIHRNLDKIRTLALMVFTLGITWWFGFAALLFNSSVLLYLFSITTGLQGFLIFLANILAKKEVWAMYSRKYKNSVLCVK